ncbi:MAG: winged helix DNA-binding domain-containing protein [Caldilineaceae bacterium]
MMNVGQLRLANQGITNPRFERPSDVVAWLGALQAQDYTGALWSIGLRMANATAQTVEQAIADRTIVRTWPMRGTLHFVAAQDVRWLLELLTPRMIVYTARRYSQLALDEVVFARSQELFVRALEGGKQLTRDEMYQVLEQAGIPTAGQRGYHFLVRAAQDGLICFGPLSGKQQTFTLLDEWVSPTKPFMRDEALAELIKRYFTSHGPATLQDLMRWAGITAGDAKIGLALVGKALCQETVEGRVYWLAPDAGQPDNETSTYLLPGFDEYLLGYSDRSAILDPAYAQRICPGGNGVFNPTIVMDGQVVGIWKRVLKKDKVLITPYPFTPFHQAQQERLIAAARPYGEFLGLQAALT